MATYIRAVILQDSFFFCLFPFPSPFFPSRRNVSASLFCSCCILWQFCIALDKAIPPSIHSGLLHYCSLSLFSAFALIVTTFSELFCCFGQSVLPLHAYCCAFSQCAHFSLSLPSSFFRCRASTILDLIQNFICHVCSCPFLLLSSSIAAQCLFGGVMASHNPPPTASHYYFLLSCASSKSHMLRVLYGSSGMSGSVRGVPMHSVALTF